MQQQIPNNQFQIQYEYPICPHFCLHSSKLPAEEHGPFNPELFDALNSLLIVALNILESNYGQNVNYKVFFFCIITLMIKRNERNSSQK